MLKISGSLLKMFCFFFFFNLYPHTGQKKAVSTLDLELWMLVSHSVGSGIEPWSFEKTASALRC